MTVVECFPYSFWKRLIVAVWLKMTVMSNFLRPPPRIVTGLAKTNLQPMSMIRLFCNLITWINNISALKVTSLLGPHTLRSWAHLTSLLLLCSHVQIIHRPLYELSLLYWLYYRYRAYACILSMHYIIDSWPHKASGRSWSVVLQFL